MSQFLGPQVQHSDYINSILAHDWPKPCWYIRYIYVEREIPRPEGCLSQAVYHPGTDRRGRSGAKVKIHLI